MTDKSSKKPDRRSDGGDRPPRRRKSSTQTAAEPAPAAPAPAERTFEGERIAKVMARAGACSRRDAEQWIAEGRVAVNGRVLTSPAFNVREGDRIEVDGQPLAERERTRLFLFHKPTGLVTSAKDPEGRDTVFDYLGRRYPELPRVVSVGRLDINTEGLLLLTNDGGLARTLELPATGWTRRYRVRAHGEIDQAQLDVLKQGVSIEGVDYAPIEAKLDRVQGANAWISMSLREGKNREIKRVLEHLGLDVNRLIRISFGPFQLGDLGEGEVEEVRLKTLREQLGKGLAELAGVDFSSPSRAPAEPEHVLAEEARQRAQKRTRKHVSVLRAERESGEKGQRARIERSATSDRKGRAVAVEKVVVARKRDAAPETRNARRFSAEREREQAPPARRGARAFAEGGARPRGRFGEQREERGEFRSRPSRGGDEMRRSAPGERRPRGERDERRGQKFEFATADVAPRSRSRSPERREERDRGEFRSSRPPKRDGEARPLRREGEGRPHAPVKRSYAGRGDQGRGDQERGERRNSRSPKREGEGRFQRKEGEQREAGQRAPGKRPSAAPGEGRGKFERADRRPRTFEGAGARSDARPRAPRSANAADKPRGPRGKPGAGPRKPGGPPRKPR
jgi:23S rRNA pseudouridine2605 synthase